MTRRPIGFAVALLLVLLVAGSCAPLARAQFRVEYRTSRLLGLSIFASTIADFPNRPQALLEVFRKSAYCDAETQARIAEFRVLHQTLSGSIDFGGHPFSRPDGVKLEDLFLWRALDARDLEELRRTTQGLLPLSSQARYFELLAGFEAIYDSLIWRPNEKKLEEYRAAFETRGAGWHADELFSRALRFYGAAWPEGLPFTIALYPIPGAKGHTSAESMGSLETVAVLVDEKDLPGRFGVIFHEICHSLYGAQPAALQEDLEHWFLEDGTPHGRLAYTMFNEGMATAIGNGWAYEIATGHPDTGSWYSDEVIDGFAKALYPSAKEYLSAPRPVDPAFVRASIDTFRREFPDAPYRFDLLLNEVVLLTDSLPEEEVRDTLRKHYRMSSIYSSTPIGGEEALKLLTDHPSTVMVALPPERVDVLSALDSHFPSLAAGLEELRRSPEESVFAGSENGRALIVLMVRAPQRVAVAAAEMRKMKRLDPAGTRWVIPD